MSFTIDPDGITAGQTGHIRYHDDIADTLNALAGGSSGGVINVRNTAYGATGNGTTDDTAALNAALSAAAKGQIVYAPQGSYLVSSPLTVPNGVQFIGTSRCMANPQGNYGHSSIALQGSIIKGSASFAGSEIINIATSGLNQGGGQTIAGITVDGSALGGASVNGITTSGFVGGITLRDVNVYGGKPASVAGLGGSGLLVANDGTSGHNPDEFHVFNCAFAGCSTAGVQVTASLADSFFTDVQCTGNGTGWVIQNGSNSRFVGCKGENSTTGPGFAFNAVSGLGVIEITSCTAQLNFQDGFTFTTGGNAGVSGWTWQLVNCHSLEDGSNGGSGGGGFAGFRSTANGSLVLLTQCQTSQGGQVYPQYGASLVSSSYGMVLTACRMAGNSANTHDDASNTHTLTTQSAISI